MSEYLYIAEENVVVIQHTYREYKYRQLCNIKVIQIQKIARGFIVRISEQFILAKIYSKIPAFWKGIIKSTGILKESDQKSPVTCSQIKALIEVTSEKQAEISFIRKRNNKNLAPPLPFWLPSAFDAEPYVSLSDGRHIHFYGKFRPVEASNSLHNFFGMHLWPSQPIIRPKKEITPLDMYDPNEFTLDIQETARHLLLCERCQSRFRLISCRTCARGYCFQCAIRIHSETGQWNHDMKFIDPQVASTRKTEKSLIYHIDLANHLSHDLRHIVKNMHNKSEVVRLKKEKELREEMEAQQKVLQQAHERATREDRKRHRAANKIAALHYFKKAQGIIFEKRLHRRLERLLPSLRRLTLAATRIQKRFRLFSTRKCIKIKSLSGALAKVIADEQGNESDMGAAVIKLELLTRQKTMMRSMKIPAAGPTATAKQRQPQAEPPKKSLDAKKNDVLRGLDERLSYEIHQRRIMERSTMLSDMKDKYSTVCQLHTTNIQYWLKESEKVYSQLTSLEADRLSREQMYRNIVSAGTAVLDGSVKSISSVYSRKMSMLHSSTKQSMTKSPSVRGGGAAGGGVARDASMRSNITRGWSTQSNLSTPANQAAVLNPETALLLKGLRLSIANLDHLIESFKAQRSWMAQCIRGNCRRLSLVQERFADTANRLAWIAMEHGVVSRIVFHSNYRIDRLQSAVDSAMAIEWLRIHYHHSIDILVAFDAQQECIVIDELQRLKSDEDLCVEIDLLMKNLADAVLQEMKYSTEKVFLDRVLLSTEAGSDEAVRYTDQAYNLKMKQATINSNVMDALKLAIQNKLNQEDQVNMAIVAFPDDDTRLSVQEMPSTIKAVLLTQFRPSVHYHVVEFLSIYLVQPWLSRQAVEDVRTEDDIVARELAVEKMSEDLRSLKEKIRLQLEAKEKVARQIGELEEEIKFMTSAAATAKDEVMEMLRTEAVDALNKELRKRLLEQEAVTAYLEKMQNLVDPADLGIMESTEEVVQMRAQLQRRAAERKRLEDVFFKLEEHAIAEIVPLVLCELRRWEAKCMECVKIEEVCKAWSVTGSEGEEDLDLQALYSANKLPIDQLDALQVSKYVYEIQDEIRDSYHLLSPRQVSSSSDMRRMDVKLRLFNVELDQKFYTFMAEQLRREVSSVNNFSELKATSEELLVSFRQSLLSQRRQKSNQIEFKERLSNVNNFRRNRLEAMIAERDARLARVEAERKRKERNYLEEIRNSKLARQANKLQKQAVAVTNTVLSALTGKAAPIDEEQLRMKRAIEEHGNESLEDKPQGVRSLRITVGDEETDKFQRQMDMLVEKKLPFYVRYNKTIGRQIVIWYQYTRSAKDFITTIDIGHTDSENRNFKDLTESGYQAIGHPTLKLVFWVKRDPTKIKGISKFDFAFSEKEEKRLSRDGYQLIGATMSNFDLPDSTLWVHYIEKVFQKDSKMNMAVATNNAIRQLNKVGKLRKEHPENKNLAAMEKRFKSELEECYMKEQSTQAGNPLEAAKRLLALDEDELESWVECFTQVDTLKTGKVKVDDIFMYLQEYMTGTGRLVFSSMNALDDDEYVEFGDFLLAVGTFCFFGNNEVLQFLYTSADKERNGIITQAEYVELLNDLHPFDKSRAVRALKMQKSRPSDTIPFDVFVRNDERYPAMLFPQFRLQRAMRTKFMGLAWWTHKLAKYQETREKIVKEAEILDALAEAEMKAFDENEARKARVLERARLIQQETSAVKLAILNARQFIDS